MKRCGSWILLVVFFFCTFSFSGFYNNSSAADSTGVEDFVTRYYELCLGRSPDPVGLYGWVTALLDGSQTGSDVAYGFVFSEEFLSKNMSDADYLTVLYEAFFNRKPDPDGRQGWLDAIAGGSSRKDVLNGFIFAVEFADLCEDYGIKAFKGHATKDQREAVEALVTRFYQKCLGRDPDSEGLNGWTKNLLNQVQTGADVAEGFVYSEEFIAKNTSNSDYLLILYEAFFDRPPDQGGWDTWLAELNGGRDRGEVLNGFIYSLEFTALCERFGIIGFRSDGNAQSEPGAGSFVSADGGVGDDTGQIDGFFMSDRGLLNGNDNRGERTVEEGDIYRVLNDNLLVNLNSYRGLQIIDISDLSKPQIIGRLQVTGYPVEMYVTGNFAYLLINSWRAYYGSRDDIDVDTYQGGVVVVADISDYKNPVIADIAPVPGNIETSRMIGNETARALYVAAGNWNGSSTTVVRSFALPQDGSLIERTTLDLGGYVQDIQATTEALLVARFDFYHDDKGSTVSVIDVSDPDGRMIEGTEIQVQGRIESKTNMDLYNNILRLVSGSFWSNTNTNHLETFDVSDINKPLAVDHQTFGDGEQLYATLFLGSKAFFVTYFRTDPFHAFEIDDRGFAQEKAEYIISGWNDFFKPVLNDTRLIGIGVNDESSGRTMAVSLYDITDLSNPNPFVARQEVSADSSWSEASWDDRAFSVLQNVVSVPAKDGTVETGVILLPFSGYNHDKGNYISAVQIFTFSDTTLTRRGLMDHGTPVRRSFITKNTTTANLSESSLSLFDNDNPDTPVELGRLELAPNYEDFLIYGNYGARLKRNFDYYYDYENLQQAVVEVVALSEHPDQAAAIATIDIPGNAVIHKMGDLLVAVFTSWDDKDDTIDTILKFVIVDMSNPRNPQRIGELTSTRTGLDAYHDPYFRDCRYGGCVSLNLLAVGDALVLPGFKHHEKLLGREKVCTTLPAVDHSAENACWNDGKSPTAGCKFYSGAVSCRSLNNAPQYCSGAIYECSIVENSNPDCVEIDPDSIKTDYSCDTSDRWRYWSSYMFDILDLSKPANPKIVTIEMPEDEESNGLIADGNDLYVNYKKPVKVENDVRPYVKYYFKRIDLSTPVQPQIGTGINIPGVLLSVDGSTIYTGDLVYGEKIVETAVNRLVIEGDHAILKARKRFSDRVVRSLIQDNLGNILIVLRAPWSLYPYYGTFYDDFYYGYGTSMGYENKDTLVILDTADDGFSVVSKFEIDNWADLRLATDGAALFSVPGGLLIINIKTATSPLAQAYYPIKGWNRKFIRQDQNVIIPAGRYGIYQFDLNEFNLLAKD